VTHRVLASTTSHKREPLIATLEVFSRLGMVDLDLNLHHFIEGHLRVDVAAAAAASFGQRVWVASGGWCDFFHDAPRIEQTFASVRRQVELTRGLGARMLRLFFGHLSRESYGPATERAIADRFRRLSDGDPDITFVFENHDTTCLVPEICRDLITQADRPNIRMNFDPINFAHAGVDPATALALLHPVVAHVHLKGLDRGAYCEFGTGDVDLTPILRELVRRGYTGDFTVEYEGPFDGTLRLYESVVRARTSVGSLDV
jgi:sugar phosphate isomerase/epimerase